MIGIQTKGEFNGDVWLGFERLTCVLIQTRMVIEGIFIKEEKYGFLTIFPMYY
jgi:Xaa-Pro aminopeptidase